MTKKILILPGDGIGQEVTASAQEVLDYLMVENALDFSITHMDVGGTAYEKHGSPLPADVLAEAKASDAILFGAVGAPQWDDLDWDHRPEQALLGLRKELELFANLRPAFLFNELASASPIKNHIIENLDILIVRELTGGVYFGEPRGLVTSESPHYAFNTMIYNEDEIRRIAKVAFEAAQKRNGKLCSVEKANVMHSGVLWRQVMTALHSAEGEGVALSHMYADNCAMQLVRNPKQFDVIVTDNLFGDLLSDCAAMLTGSLGMLPSASLGTPDPGTGLPKAMYEPVHGSAPDIAGKGLANPLAQFLSFAMMLRYSFDQADEADLVEKAVNIALESKRTGDIMAPGCEQTGTDGMTKAVLDAMDRLAR